MPVVHVLLDKGADVAAKDDVSRVGDAPFASQPAAPNLRLTAYSQACMLSLAPCLHVITRALLLAVLQNGTTPLHAAAHWGHSAAAKVLLDAGADMAAKDRVSGATSDALSFAPPGLGSAAWTTMVN